MPVAPRITCALALLLACQQNEHVGDSARSMAPMPIASAQPHKPGDRVDVDGIVVTFLDGGMIGLSGRDKWGNSLDTTYENSEFLRNALPVLERSITAEQLAGLRALVGVR